jgi:biofilm PGA synthesis lipoprotein PgaB
MQHSGFANFETHAYKGHNYARFIPGNKQRPWYLARIYDPVTKKIETETSYQTRVSADLYRARTLISNHLGGERLAFAYPYGARDDASDQAAHMAGLRVLFTVRAGIVTPGTDPDALPRVNGGSPAVTVPALEQSIRQVAMGKRYTRFDLPAIRKLQRGARIIRLENCCRIGPLPTEK